MKFEKFKKELAAHSLNGYHLINDKKIERNEELLKNEGLSSEYVAFHIHIGSGSFYAGSLIIFDFKDDNYFSFNNQVNDIGIDDFIAIGYDGTTNGCFCIRKYENKNSVYWLYWNDIEPFLISNSFCLWIENSSDQYFNEKIYKGYKTIRDINSVMRVISERAKFDVKLKSFDKELVAHPNEQKKYLKRYNKVIFEVTKKSDTFISDLTVKLFRSGSSVGNDNVEYVTINVAEIQVQKPCLIESYLFDPFNIPFNSIESLYNPNIDLGSPMRIKFKEITNHI